MAHRNHSIILAFVLVTVSAWAQIPAVLTARAATYTGVTDITHTSEPVCVGVPLADSEAISSTATLGLTEPSVGQFRSLGTWPSGNIKWVQVCTELTVSASSTATFTLNNSGSGNFGGSDLVTDAHKCDGSADSNFLCIDTGTTKFQWKKVPFDPFNKVTVNSKVVLDSSVTSNPGFTIVGPSPTAIAIANPTAFPTINTVTQSSTPAFNGWFAYTYLDNAGNESYASSPNNKSTTLGNAFSVVAPTNPGGSIVGWNLYFTDYNNSRNPVKQNASGVGCTAANGDGSCTFAGPWLEPVSGITQTGGPPCGGCNTTTYSSVNDSSASITIEQNGPVMGAIKADWTFKDGSGNAYLKGRVRFYYYKSKNYAKVQASLRNADCSVLNCTQAERAYKGFNQFEIRLKPVTDMSGAKSFAFGDPSSASSRTAAFSGTENAYIYQAFNSTQNDSEYGGNITKFLSYIARSAPAGPYSQNGMQVTEGASNLATNTNAQNSNTNSVEGWADDYVTSTGVGIEVGHYAMAGYWPKAIQFNTGGADIIIGIWPDQSLYTGACGTSPCINKNSPYFIASAAHQIHDVFLNFHDTALNDSQRIAAFKAFQHYLIAAATPAYYTFTNALWYSMPSPTDEDNYFKNLAATASPLIASSKACCYSDATPLTHRSHTWALAGGTNQNEFHLRDIWTFLQRGMTGRYLDAMQFYRFMAEQGLPRSDFAGGYRTLMDFANWTILGCPGQRNNANGLYQKTPASSFTHTDGPCTDQEHLHAYGMPFAYFLTGDEELRDALLEGGKDLYMNPHTYVSQSDTSGCGNGETGVGGNQNAPAQGCHTQSSRSLGGVLYWEARLYDLLKSTGDSDADLAVTASNTAGPRPLAEAILAGTLFRNLKADPNGYGDSVWWGMSQARGIDWNTHGLSSALNQYLTCGPVPPKIRMQEEPFATGIMAGGMHEIFQMEQLYNPSWSNMQLLKDRMEGLYRYFVNESFNSDFADWHNAGDHYLLNVDAQNSGTDCSQGWWNIGSAAEARQQMTNYFLVGQDALGTSYTDGQGFWKNYMAHKIGYGGPGWTEFGYMAISDLVFRYLTAGNTPPQKVALTSFTDNGGGSYSLGWTAPGGISAYHLKYKQGKSIQDWLTFDPVNYVWVSDPTTAWPYFGSPDTTQQPVSGDTSITVTGLPTGLTSPNFYLRGFASAPAGDTTPPTCSLTAPSTGTYSGTITISANASDNVGVTRVDFFYSSTNLISNDFTSPYSISWDTHNVSNGTYLLGCTAYDAAGNSGKSTSVSITVNNSSQVGTGTSSTSGDTIRQDVTVQ